MLIRTITYSPAPPPKRVDECPLKIVKMLFISSYKLFSFVGYLDVYFLGHPGKWLCKKAKIKFKIYDFINFRF